MPSAKDEAILREMADKTTRVGELAAAAADEAQLLVRLILELRKEGCSWESIGKALSLPAYCVMVLAGQTAKNRMLPEYQRAARR